MLRPHHRVYLTAFLLDAAVMVVFATTPFFVFNEIGGAEAMAGMVGAIQMAAYALSCMVSSRFVARADNGLRWALFGAVFFVFFSCLMPFRPEFVFCSVISFCSFVALGLVWPALQSWIGAEPDAAQRARHMAYFSISAGCGFALSPLLGGPLYDMDYRLPFVALGLLGIMIVLLIGTLPREDTHFAVAEGEDDDVAAPESAGTGGVNLPVAWCALFMANTLVGATRSVYPMRVMELQEAGSLNILFGAGPSAQLGQGPATTFSWLISILWMSTALCFFVLGRKHHWQHRVYLLPWLQFLAAGAAWLLGYTHSLFLMLACFAAIGVNFGFSFFVALAYSLADPVHKHRRAAMTEGILGAGVFAGSIGFGYLAGLYSVHVPFLYTPLFVAVGIVFQWWLLRRGRRREGLAGQSSPSVEK